MIVCPECAYEWNPSNDSTDGAVDASNNIIKDVEISDSLKTRLEIKFKSNHRFLLELK